MTLKTPIVSDLKEFFGIDDVKFLPENKEERIADVKELLRYTKRRILIRGGELNSKIYDVIIPSVEELLDKDKNIYIKIIFGPKIDVENKKLVSFVTDPKYKNRTKIRWRGSRGPPHSWVIDSEYICLEDDHEQLSPMGNRKGIIGRTPYSRLGEKYARHFDELWTKVEPFDIEKKINEAKPLSEEDLYKDNVFGFITYKESATSYSAPATREQINELKKCIIKNN